MNKVRSGMSVQEAVEDIINRGVGELRKNAFGDDAEDAKNFPWTRDQAWTLLNLLAKNSEVPYHQVLFDYPFKGDEVALRSMEHAELITITTQDGECRAIVPSLYSKLHTSRSTFCYSSGETSVYMGFRTLSQW